MLMTRVVDQARDFEVPIPADLEKLGRSTLARVTGNPDGPLVAVLGGISANRCVCSGVEGERGWWPGLVGPGKAVDTDRYRVLGLDFAADETGRYAPTSLEQARVLRAALDVLRVPRLHAIVGASYGGMVALSLAEHFPDRVDRLATISAPAEPHPTATAARELQRRVVGLAIASGDGEAGLAIARGMAMLTYRTPGEFAERFTGGIPDGDPLATSGPGAYLRNRGEAYPKVMSPERFLSLSGSIDRHAVEPERIAHSTLLIGASTDQLVPPCQLQALAARLPNAELHLLDCLYGHDMFLKEADRVGALVGPFLADA